MANARIITVGKKNATTGAFEPDNAVATPRLIGVINPANIVNGSLITGNLGQYLFTNIPNDFYCFYDGAVIREDVLGKLIDGGVPIMNPFTLPYLNLHSGGYYNADSKEIRNLATGTTSNSAISLSQAQGLFLLLAGGTMTGGINMGNQAMTNLPAPASDAAPMRKLDTYNNFLQLNPSTDAQSVFKKVLFRNYPPVLLTDAASLQEAVSKGQMERYVASILAGITAGEVTAFQQSGNIRRVIPSGTQEDNKVYRTIEAAKTNAESYAEADEIISIVIEGNGVDTSVLTNYNLLPAGALAAFVNYVGIDRNIRVIVAEDNYTGDATNRPILSTMTIDNENDAAETNIEDVIIHDVKIFNTFGTGIYNFTDCHFKGICEIEGCIATFDASCTGIIYDVDNDKYIYLGSSIYVGVYDVMTTNGDIRGRRLLGRQGADIASASSISLGDGNFFHITGTTTINLMSVSNWTPGSRITLYFESNITVNHAASPSAPNYPFIWKTGANKSVLADQIFTFILAEGSLFWQEE